MRLIRQKHPNTDLRGVYRVPSEADEARRIRGERPSLGQIMAAGREGQEGLERLLRDYPRRTD